MPKATQSQNKWEAEGAKTKLVIATKVSYDPPNDEEKKRVASIILASQKEIQGLRYQTDDVVGEWRVLRFLRNHQGDVDKATKMFKANLIRRTNSDHLVEEMGAEVRGMSKGEFVAWFMGRRNPYLPFCPYGGENAEGTVTYVFVRQGGADFKKFGNARTADQPITDEVFLILQAHEWLMWHLNEQCKKLNKMCYMRKIMDFGGLATNPFLIGPVKNIVLEGMKTMGVDYCDGDDQFILINTPTLFDIIFPIAKLFLTKRQRSKFHSINGSEIGKYCESPPKGLGGTAVTCADPFLYETMAPDAITKHLVDRIALRKNWASKIPMTQKEMEKCFKN